MHVYKIYIYIYIYIILCEIKMADSNADNLKLG